VIFVPDLLRGPSEKTIHVVVRDAIADLLHGHTHKILYRFLLSLGSRYKVKLQTICNK